MLSHQVAVLYFSATSAPTPELIPTCWGRNTQPLSPTFSFAAFLVSESIQLTYFRFSSNAHLISATIPSTWSTETEGSQEHIMSHSGSSYFVSVGLWSAYNGLAVLGKGVLDKHGSESEAQCAVRVADAQLPAWSAALRQQKKHIETC